MTSILQIQMSTMKVSDLPRLGKAIGITLLDSNRTDELLVAEEITSQYRFDSMIERFCDSEEGRALLRDRPCVSRAEVDFDALLALPEDTLGHRYASHMKRHELDPDALAGPVARGHDTVAGFLHERYRQTHDLWHTMTELGVEGHEEIILHAFTFAQLRLPYSALLLLLGGVKHIVLEGRWRALRYALVDAYEKGRRSQWLLPVYWERYFEEPFEHVRGRFGVEPCMS